MNQLGTHGILSHQSASESVFCTDQDPYDTLLLRISVRVMGSDSPEPEEVQLHSRWASLLQSVGPGDLLEVEGAEEAMDLEPGAPGCFSVHGERPVVTIHREGFKFRVDKQTMQALQNQTLQLPEWLRLPPAKKAGKVYKYHGWLCTLRDGADANLWAVVWEVSRPGPIFEKGWTRQSFVVVDPTFEHFSCAEWSNVEKLPVYSMTTSIEGKKVEALPHLGMGDVIRVHRARISSKPPRYINIRQQGQSATVAFPCPNELLESESLDNGVEVAFRGLQGENNTIVPADKARARKLQMWIQQRLSKESMSQYLTTIRELVDLSAQRDLVVQVQKVEVSPGTSPLRLVVTDGSVPPISLDVSAPALAAQWLGAGVKVGHWLRLQQVRSTGLGSTEALTVSAANITQVPSWCFDVQVRRQQVEKMQIVQVEPMQRPESSAAPSAPSPAAAHRALARAAKVPRESRGSGDTELDEDEETPPTARAEVEASAATSSRRPKSQLKTVYVDTIQPKRLGEVADATAKGEKCMVLSHFTVARICDVSGADATQAKSLVATRCCCCGHTFPAPDSDVRAVKRRRQVWPCGHWLFRLEFRFKLALQQDDQLIWVFVADEFCALLGESAEDVVGNHEARERAQKRLNALREDLSKPRVPELSHSMAVYRHDGPDTCIFGSYVVSDTSLELVPE